jgi:protein-disulfide isomerase
MKPFYALVAAIAVGGLSVLAWMTTRHGAVSIPANVVVQTADTAGFRGYLLGSPAAPVEVTEYADYQCPACQVFETVQFPDVKSRLIESGRLRWRYRDFPLQQHRHSRVAAHAAACADEQGKFWEMHRMIYEAQGDWEAKSDASGVFRDFVKAAGLDVGKYDACMTSAKYAGRIQASYAEGMKVGVASTPTVMVGGRLYAGVQNYEMLRHLVDSLAPLAGPKAPTPEAGKLGAPGAR